MALDQNFVDKVLSDMKSLPAVRDLGYVKVIVLFALLEAWADTRSGNPAQSQSKAVAYLRAATSPLATIYNDFPIDFYASLLASALLCGLKIPPPGKRSDGLNDYLPNNNFADIVGLLYEIRNKLVHAEWKFSWVMGKNDNEKILVSCAADLLERWLRWVRIKNAW